MILISLSFWIILHKWNQLLQRLRWGTKQVKRFITKRTFSLPKLATVKTQSFKILKCGPCQFRNHNNKIMIYLKTLICSQWFTVNSIKTSNWPFIMMIRIIKEVRQLVVVEEPLLKRVPLIQPLIKIRVMKCNLDHMWTLTQIVISKYWIQSSKQKSMKMIKYYCAMIR